MDHARAIRLLYRAALIVLTATASPPLAVAAPFCVQTQAIPPQCMFVDARSCNQRAVQLGGTCTVNPAEAHVSPGLGHHCLLTAARASACIYVDRNDCEREAQRQQGVCIDEPGRPESPVADPYRDIRPSMAGD